MKCDIFLLGSPGEQAIYEDLISITLFPMTGTGPSQSETTSYRLSLVSTRGRPAPRSLYAGPGLPDSSCCESHPLPSLTDQALFWPRTDHCYHRLTLRSVFNNKSSTRRRGEGVGEVSHCPSLAQAVQL